MEQISTTEVVGIGAVVVAFIAFLRWFTNREDERAKRYETLIEKNTQVLASVKEVVQTNTDMTKQNIETQRVVNDKLTELLYKSLQKNGKPE